MFSFHTSQTHHTRTKHDTKQAFCAGIIALSIILAQDKTVTPAGTHVCFPCTFFPTPQLTHANNPFSNHPPHTHKRTPPISFHTYTQIDNGKKGTGNECKTIAALAEHLPSRFRLNGDASGALGCAWPVSATALRCALAGAALVLGGVSLGCALVRRSRWASVVSLLLAAAGVGLGYAAYADAVRVAASRSWCTQGMPGMPFVSRPRSIDCRYAWPVLTACADAAGAVVLALLAWASTCFACKAGPRPRRRRGDVGSERALLINDDAQEGGAVVEEEDTPARFERDDDGSGARGHTGVDFDSESQARYAPMSKTDRSAAQRKDKTAKSKTKGKTTAAPAPAPVPEGMFDFDSVESDSKTTPGAEPTVVADDAHSAVVASGRSATSPKTQQKQAPQKQPQPQARQPQQPPQPAPAPQQPQMSGYVDFDSLASNDPSGF